MIKTAYKKKRGNFEKGAAALGLILTLLAILLVAGFIISSSGFIQNEAVSNQDRAAAAFYAAETGIRDAMQKISRNKNYSDTNGYGLTVGESSAYVSVVVLSSPTKSVPGQTQITSSGTNGNNTKKIKAAVDIDFNGKVTVNSWEELSS